MGSDITPTTKVMECITGSGLKMPLPFGSITVCDNDVAMLVCVCVCVCVTTTWGFCAEFACILLLNECLDADCINSEQLNGCNLSDVMYVCVYIVMLFPREKLYMVPGCIVCPLVLHEYCRK